MAYSKVCLLYLFLYLCISLPLQHLVADRGKLMQAVGERQCGTV